MTSGSWRWIVASSELSMARSAFTVWKGERSVFPRASNPGGNFSMGRTMVFSELGRRSGGDGSSMLPRQGRERDSSADSGVETAYILPMCAC